ncbi:MAG: branched-chain amino acid ABC transporter permease [Nakamurella sp.]
MRQIRLGAGAVALIALVAVPMVTDSFATTLVTRGMTWGLLGLAVWFLLRISNLPSFGHAAFFGVAAYSAGLAVTEWQITNLFVTLALSVLLTCLVAVPIALVTTRLSGIAFLLVTLAFAEMLRSLALRWRAVGGSDGLVGVTRPDTWPLPLSLATPSHFYYVVLAVLLICAVLLVVVIGSPFGGVLAGLRESEPRMSALGYNPMFYRVAAFVLSAALAGVAGVMQTYLDRFANPEDLGALVSARGLLIAVIAGASLWAVPVTAIALTIVEDLLSTQTTHWMGLIGVIYIVVSLLPNTSTQVADLRRLVRRRIARRNPPEPRVADQKESV